MIRKLPDRLLKDRITIRKPVQSFISGTKKPVFEHQLVATNVKARFNPAGTGLDRNVLGQTPKRGARLFVNVEDLPPEGLKENFEVVNEATGEGYVVTETKNYFGHHLEVALSETKS
ncbi:MAG: hypothetical protein KCHDKBKB_02790 [Elusimicrobia bacterium]|nr:hypothetical protein [Elusimicrobiota bacterium]